MGLRILLRLTYLKLYLPFLGLVNGVKQPDGTVKSLTPKQVGDLLGHSTSQITEMYYVRDNSKLRGITDNFEI